MRATLILCDFAQATAGKLTMVGAGWETLNVPGPMGIGVIFEVDWNETNVPHRLMIDLVDQDGQAVAVPTPGGLEPVRVEAAFEVGRPPGMIHGASSVGTFGFNTGPIPFQAPGRYRWRLFVNKDSKEEWQRAFTVAAGAVFPVEGLD